MRLSKVSEAFFDTFTQKFELDTGDAEAMQVVDVWPENANIRMEMSGAAVSGRGKMNACVLTLDAAGRPRYVERILDIDFNKEIKSLSENAKCDGDILVKKMEARITGGGKMEIRVEFLYYVWISSEIGARTVFSVFMDESRKRERKYQDSLVIYYADKDERLWDIAREYCTAVDSIKTENALSYDILDEGEMILIPT